MKKIPLLFLILILILPYMTVKAQDKEIDAILSSAEALFKYMKLKNYERIWTALTEKSKGIIINDTYKAEGARYTKAALLVDFQKGGTIAKAYWDSYLENFNPDIVLTQSSWKMGKIEGNRAEIIIQYKKAENPAYLKMFKEGGIWKVGLEETFGTRK